MSDLHLDPEVEILAGRLDRALPPNDSFIPPETQDSLVNTAALLARSAHAVPELSDSARESIKAKMLMKYQTIYPPPLTAVTTPRKQRRPFAAAIKWGAAAVLAITLVGASLTPVMAASVPGDTLYPVKRWVETIELAIASAPDTRVNVYLAQAERRAEEAVRLLARRQYNSEVMTQARQSIEAAQTIALEQGENNPALLERSTQIISVLALVEAQKPNLPDQASDHANRSGGDNANNASGSAGGSAAVDTPEAVRTQRPNTGRPTVDPEETDRVIITPRPFIAPQGQGSGQGQGQGQGGGQGQGPGQGGGQGQGPG